MADPARYYLDPVYDHDGKRAWLHHERAPSGDWIKWADFEDYKAAQRRNASLETNTSLGVEIAHLRAENERLRSGSFVTAVPSEQYERVIKAGDRMALHAKEEGTGWELHDAADAWLAAKEGRDANGCFVNHNKVAQYLPKPNAANEGRDAK